jgi:glycosyltransferase involved in cell wall biosynthesis
MSINGRPSLCILLVNTSDQGGGAEAVSTQLRKALLARDHEAYLAVGVRHDQESVFIANWEERSWLSRRLLRLSHTIEDHRGRMGGEGAISRTFRWLAGPIRDTRKRLGHEDFYFPATDNLLALTPSPVDLVHIHNLHGDYFDLRQLSSISRRVPTAVTLHDQWMMTGHCAYSLDCERWRTGCGSCPHLDTYPAIPRDSTRGNLARKRSIYSKSRLYLSAPSQWLLDQIPDSALSQAVRGTTRLIPNGVDQSVFNASRRAAERADLGVPEDTIVVTFVANYALSNPYKDWTTLHDALRLLGERSPKRVLAFAIGESGKRNQLGNVTVQPVDRVDDKERLASWYCASDLYVQPSRADNHPLTVLESLSCGTPVVATAVGGILEQLRPLSSVPGSVRGGVPVGEATGVLVPVADPEALARCLTNLIERPHDLAQMANNAARDARERFTLDRYVSETLDWYHDILKWEAGNEIEEDGSSLPTGTRR